MVQNEDSNFLSLSGLLSSGHNAILHQGAK